MAQEKYEEFMGSENSSSIYFQMKHTTRFRAPETEHEKDFADKTLKERKSKEEINKVKTPITN
jgi:hypothetical protein